jgi:hypothetical protein
MQIKVHIGFFKRNQPFNNQTKTKKEANNAAGAPYSNQSGLGSGVCTNAVSGIGWSLKKLISGSAPHAHALQKRDTTPINATSLSSF